MGSSSGTQLLPTLDLKRDYYVKNFRSSLFNPALSRQFQVKWCLLALMGSSCSGPHHILICEWISHTIHFSFLTRFWVFRRPMRALRSPRWPVDPRRDASLLIGARFKKWFKEYAWVQYTSCLWPFVRVLVTEAVGLFFVNSWSMRKITTSWQSGPGPMPRRLSTETLPACSSRHVRSHYWDFLSFALPPRRAHVATRMLKHTDDRWVRCPHTCHPVGSDATSVPHVRVIRKRHKDMDVIWSEQRKRRIFLMWNICRVWVRSVTTHRE